MERRVGEYLKVEEHSKVREFERKGWRGGAGEEGLERRILEHPKVGEYTRVGEYSRFIVRVFRV